jgi:hypothetical protein
MATGLDPGQPGRSNAEPLGHHFLVAARAFRGASHSLQVGWRAALAFVGFIALGAQMDLIGALWLMISEQPSAVGQAVRRKAPASRSALAVAVRLAERDQAWSVSIQWQRAREQ